jgi:hypothetical protein
VKASIIPEGTCPVSPIKNRAPFNPAFTVTCETGLHKMPPRSRNPKVVDDSSTLKILLASSPSSPFRLGDLPPEIRILIFTEHLVWRWQARGMTYGSGRKEFNTPELIIALRADPKLCTEALDVYFDNCTFTISSNNEARFRYMTRRTLRRVRSLEIWYGYVAPKPVRPNKTCADGDV